MNIKKHLPWLGALLPVASMQAETKPNVVVIYVCLLYTSDAADD